MIGIGKRHSPELITSRLVLRPPVHDDYHAWSTLREQSQAFLSPWEPSWAQGHLSRRAFVSRVYWARRSIRAGTAVPLFLTRTSDGALLGAVTVDNIRRGPAQAASLGYWIGERFARQGYMSEAMGAVIHYSFSELDLSRLEAACLPQNASSRRLLEKTGFKYEGVAQSYLQIAGRWRSHVCYAVLRSDRRGKSESG